MKPTSIQATDPAPRSQIGIPARAARSEGAATMEIADMEQFARAELNLRYALEMAGLCLEPLGYIQDGRAQCRVLAADTKSTEAGHLGGGAIQSTLSALIDRARHGGDEKTPPTGTGMGISGEGERRGGESALGTADTGSGGIDSPDVEQSKGEPDVAGGAVSPADASSTRDKVDTERLRRRIQLGPDVITVNGHAMPWASAITRPALTTDETSKRVTLRVAGAEHLLRDHNGNRIRLSKPNGAICVGDTLEIGEIHKERVLVVTIPDQPELDLDYGEGGDANDDDDQRDD